MSSSLLLRLARLLFRSELRQAESRVQELEAESLESALPEGFRTEKSTEEHAPQQPNLVRTMLNIANGAIWGVLARKGLTALTTYDGAYLGGVVWANFAACFVMGMAIGSETLWEALLDAKEPARYAGKGAVPLYVGITTGFCGTCSSFSSFVLEAFNKAANTLPHTYGYPNAAYGIMDALAVCLAQVAVSAGGFHAGKHLAAHEATFKVKFSRKVYPRFEMASSIVGVAAYVIVIVLLATKAAGSWRSWTFACLFAPWGALLRFDLSRRLNPLVPNFPVGTFVANIAGCVLLAVFTVLARGRSARSVSTPLVKWPIACHVLAGLDDGYCGALTTVSTFVVELFGLADKHAYFYGIVSVGTGFACMVLIVGSYNWAVGLTAAVCS